MATNKPILILSGKTIDCTGIVVKDNTVLEGRTLPSFIVLQLSLYNEKTYNTILIDNNSTPSLTNFLAGTVQLINSGTLGKTLLDERLIELSCGLIQLSYHWFNTTNKTITYTKGKKEVTGSALPIPDSIYINNKIYTVNRNKSSVTKLILNEELEFSGTGLLVSGQFDTYSVINDCAIVRGHTKAIASLPVLDCEKDECSVDGTEVDRLMRDLGILKSAYAKLRCNDLVNANLLLKRLCRTYADACSNKTEVIGDCLNCNEAYTSPCSNCN